MKHLKWLPMLLMGVALMPHAQAADPGKVLRVAFSAPETGFDLVKVHDVYSMAVGENIFDGLLTYDYLARPLKVVPNTASAMPEVSPDGKVFTFKVKPGIYFADDPAFKGKKRELTAADYAYTFKRFADPLNNAPSGASYMDFIAGLEEASKKAAKTGKFDYDTPISGLQVLDRYTLRIVLKKPNFGFLYTIAAKDSGAVAREVIETYSKDTLSHPVGTGPFMLKEWKPGNRIVLVANPGYRKTVFDGSPGSEPGDAEIYRSLKGKTLPQVGRVEIRIIEEDQPRWLSFMNKQLDWINVPKSAMKSALNINPADPYDTTLRPVLAKRSIRLSHTLGLDVTYAYFNLKDPVIGGYGKDKVALRRAIAMAYPLQKEVIPLLYGNQAIPLQGLVPVGMVGFDPHFQGQVPYDPATANALLDEFGYKIGPDGYRTLPNGKPLVIEQGTQSSATDKQFNEIWQKAFDSIKVRVRFKTAKWNENLKAAYAYKLQMWSLGGSASTPDGDDFVSSFSSRLIGQGNLAGYQVAAYDKAYDASQILPDGAERQALYSKMNRLVAAQQPYVLGVTRFYNELTQGYVSGFKRHPISTFGGFWRYVDVAPH
ncbi:ABC transporter substrate-binding protein [Chromobacterium subtsugae]|uniref:ABC transporter substrate-binding protein n=1 Tax=Chromobacterium subtsugae TaxID=251747 RepID=UPI0007F8C3E4|nr:ABC transporter substrate-binding protein [Chromobacterium subtsugae]OBU85540.1 ABC transporter substrate-binding protein [Chromobacterium subtsugae]